MTEYEKVGPSVNIELSGNTTQSARIAVLTDGTSSTAEILVENEYGGFDVMGRGVARRRKGDTRQPELGTRLAIGRALKHAASSYEEHLRKRGYEL
ncbi:hypothetical protein C6N75_09745 [Streptomyces solincola]|uniref:Uncharacterized protein n=1 Tax=Streptomyces solincola TaxID=2100817 RepID=A0A2S9PYD6_9ACTN|nr:dsRBD fold-containing protein [Streptomyces solincola]PRH79357.1 hypothetical protein C6N75_09745 [Streptomyces solincola]